MADANSTTVNLENARLKISAISHSIDDVIQHLMTIAEGCSDQERRMEQSLWIAIRGLMSAGIVSDSLAAQIGAVPLQSADEWLLVDAGYAS